MAKVKVGIDGESRAKWGAVEWLASSILCLAVGAGGGMLSAKDAKQDERLSVVETRQEMSDELLDEVRQIVPLMQRMDERMSSMQGQITEIKDDVRARP